MIEAYTDSQERQLRKLLNELELGDKRASQLLREMKTLAGSQINEEVLKTLWLQRLPTHIQLVLSASEGVTLSKMAEVADKLQEIQSYSNSTGSISTLTKNTEIPVVPTPRDFDAVSKLQDLYTQIATLSTRIDQLVDDKGRSRSLQRRWTPCRRSNSRVRGYCFYHERFGKKARKCKSPCTFKPLEN